jgi:hypothetical protein
VSQRTNENDIQLSEMAMTLASSLKEWFLVMEPCRNLLLLASSLILGDSWFNIADGTDQVFYLDETYFDLWVSSAICPVTKIRFSSKVGIYC